MIVVRRPGLLTTIQDLGRAGYAHLGVPLAGAVDVPSLRLANRLVGNAAGTAALEITMAGPELVPEAPTVVALTGGRVEASVDGRPLAMNMAQPVPPGGVLSIGRVTEGVRSYLGVRGGIDVEPVLGSRSTDTLSGLGPARLTAGMHLPVGSSYAGSPPEEHADRPSQHAAGSPLEQVVLPPNVGRETVLRVTLGPRADLFVPAAADALQETVWTVTPRSDRTGVRLAGPPLGRRHGRELPSEGLVTGSVQVPPDGQPILFLANHPATGGYPVIAVVVSADVPLAAQARPGSRVRFRLVASALSSSGAPPLPGR